jgi:hypothetical protein
MKTNSEIATNTPTFVWIRRRIIVGEEYHSAVFDTLIFAGTRRPHRMSLTNPGHMGHDGLHVVVNNQPLRTLRSPGPLRSRFVAGPEKRLPICDPRSFNRRLVTIRLCYRASAGGLFIQFTLFRSIGWALKIDAVTVRIGE